MTAAVFVDSNVLVYSRDTRDPVKHARAADWIATLWRDGTGRVSAQVLSECYYTLTRKLRPGLPHDEAWEDISALMAWRPQPIDVDVLQRSHELERRFAVNWWDSLIVAAAQLQGCALLLSEDLQDGMSFGTVTVRNPFLLQAEDRHAAYGKELGAVARHRGRGRPKRMA